VIEIRHYVNRAGKDVFDDWLSELADARAQAKIASRINRLAAGNFGDCKPLR
jgi:putative addiction module killer protein